MSTLPTQTQPPSLDEAFRPLTKKQRLYSTALVLGIVGACMLLITHWIAGNFGVITVEQMMLNLGGAENGDDSLITSFIWQALALPIGLVALVIVISVMTVKLTKRWFASRAKSPRKSGLPMLAIVASTALFLVSSTQLAGQMSIADSILARTSTDSLAGAYIDPGKAIAPDTKRNLITIYLESMEPTFGNSAIFGQNLLEPLEAATSGWASIDSYAQGDGLGWTMAGIVGTQCSLPIKANANGLGGQGEEDGEATLTEQNQIGTTDEHFLPGATCLGDVLSGAGYTNHFMGGADGSFAAKKLFMTDHGYGEFLDKSTWKAQGETNMNRWGLEDARLFDLATQKALELHAKGEPFNLTMLSVDSHRPGYPSSTCTETLGNQLERAVKCSMQYVAGFIESLEQAGVLDDTVVVIMGDHKYMAPDADFFQGKPSEDIERTVYNRMWSPDGVVIRNQSTDQYAMLPTMLELLGFELPEGRAGIGVSALGDYPLNGTIYGLDPASRQRLILAPSSDLYDKLWSAQ